ncbi:hypothetical protein [Agrobacterium rosae]|uniref:Uncharacterized protein n=1 Tax=Agrobacterium rosae TaxID=1972867 RepID=A0A1R3T803_9HYPH|nr:hypothetical protein [Agrobacterium rosae]SCX03038.1 hypothetical protein DSM25559_0283 [Agrobacterium rosae]
MGGKNIKLSDLGWAAATLAFGAIFGFMFGMLGFVVVHGFGMVLVLMLPFFLIQLLFQAAFSRMLLFIISFLKIHQMIRLSRRPKNILGGAAIVFTWDFRLEPLTAFSPSGPFRSGKINHTTAQAWFRTSLMDDFKMAYDNSMHKLRTITPI